MKMSLSPYPMEIICDLRFQQLRSCGMVSCVKVTDKSDEHAAIQHNICQFIVYLASKLIHHEP